MSTTDSAQILLVEDDEKLTGLISMYLEKQGLSVSCEHNGAAAPARILREQPELVILDLMVRRGLLSPDEPGYGEIIHGLRLPE